MSRKDQETNRGKNKALFLAGVVIVALAGVVGEFNITGQATGDGGAKTGCGGQNETSVTAQKAPTTQENALYARSSSLWPTDEESGFALIPVCFVSDGNEEERNIVKQVMNGKRSWSNYGGLRFVDWRVGCEGCTDENGNESECGGIHVYNDEPRGAGTGTEIGAKNTPYLATNVLINHG